MIPYKFECVLSLSSFCVKLIKMMSNNNIYPIQLLNDLHNWFPDILYNPGRFQNVQDLLEYIRQGANINPFTHGLQFYNARQRNGNNSSQSSNINPDNIARYQSAASRGNSYVPRPSRNVSSNDLVGYRIPVSDSDVSQILGRLNNISPVTFRFSNNNDRLPSIFDNIQIPLGNPLHQLFSSTMLENFLNQSVIIRPSEDDINRTTTTSIAPNIQDDICTICQDNIEEGQNMRKINHCNHYFHQDCIDTWFEGNVHCPTCRYDIRDTPVINSNTS